MPISGGVIVGNAADRGKPCSKGVGVLQTL